MYMYKIITMCGFAEPVYLKQALQGVTYYSGIHAFCKVCCSAGEKKHTQTHTTTHTQPHTHTLTHTHTHTHTHTTTHTI